MNVSQHFLLSEGETKGKVLVLSLIVLIGAIVVLWELNSNRIARNCFLGTDCDEPVVQCRKAHHIRPLNTGNHCTQYPTIFELEILDY